ncbi:hypothetical protein CBS9595_004240 [Malassezia furfur]|nr:hypothetical protein CBS9595_004240 [Malassezia furfur]
MWDWYVALLTQGLAVLSGVFIGSSFVFKKKGLLSAQRKYETTAGESHAYLKSPMWWTGMIIMVLGEVLNFVAYAFADAVLVTPMGALSVVVCAVLSSIFLKECLTLFGKVGCFLCIVGSVIIAVNAPEQKTSGNIREYEKLFIAPGFLTWLGICVVAALVLIFLVAPRYGKKTMLVYITVCSVIGGLSVSVTSGLGAAIILSIRGRNQFTYWFTYFLLGFIIVTLLVEINYLNKALELFNTAAVTPTYYVMFTAATIITSIILSQGMRASAATIVTIVFGFFVICSGIVLLQLSKMDPQELKEQPGVDRKSSILVRMTQLPHEPEKSEEITHIEDPGMDTVRGGMGIVGSILRANSTRRARSQRRCDDDEDGMGGEVQRYQLYDRPVSYTPTNSAPGSPATHTTIKFAPGADEPHGHHDAHASSHRVHHHDLQHDSALPLAGAINIGHALAPILEHKKRSTSGSQRSTSTRRRTSEKRTGHHIIGSDITFDDEDDVDLGEQSAADTHGMDVDLPPIWKDASDDETYGVASPTMIVDEYCREPFTPTSGPTSPGQRTPSVGLRSFSRGWRQDAQNTDDGPLRDALGLLKLRKSSRGSAAGAPSGREASPPPPPLPFLRPERRSTAPEETHLLP